MLSHQVQGKSIEEFYEKYQDLIIRLDIQESTHKMILMFVGSLHGIKNQIKDHKMMQV